MTASSTARFEFIGHALRGDGPFRPTATIDGTIATTSKSYLDRYAREPDQKYARRNAVAWYATPLGRACSRFAGYLSTRAPQRDLGHQMYELMSDDLDGKGNAIDVWFQQFAVDFKARGSMLVLVDMPATTGITRSEQLANRRVPYWTQIAPESLVEYVVGDDGKFDFVKFRGETENTDGERKPCVWYFNRERWEACDEQGDVMKQGEHPLRECPVLIAVESGDYPSFGPFAPIADISKRLFNMNSELDEILRATTFPMLALQVPDGASNPEKQSAAKVAGEVIGTQNLVTYTGTTPSFIAPPDGPARVYMDRIAALGREIDEVGLNVAAINERESGLAMQHRFQTINAELSRFAGRLEDLERRAWSLSARWLGFKKEPEIQWPRDFNLADVEQELRILAEMQAGGMPAEVIAEQQKRIVSIQFGGLSPMRIEEITQAIDERRLEPRIVDRQTTTSEMTALGSQ